MFELRTHSGKRESEVPEVFELVEIAWQDAQIIRGWQDLDFIRDFRPANILSVGFLVKNTPEYVTILQSLDNEDGGADALCIPAPWVCSITALARQGIIEVGKETAPEGGTNDNQDAPSCEATDCPGALTATGTWV